MLKRLLLTSLAALAIFGAAWAASPDNIPDVHVGDVWKYRSIDGYTNETTLEFSHRIIKLNAEEITIQLKNKNVSKTKLLYYTREWNVIDTGDTRFDPFCPEYKFPMSVGDSWNQGYKSSDTHGASYSSFVRAKVVAFEKVTVPAGTFDAYRLERDIESRSAGPDANSQKSRIITWYAPAIKKYVRMEITNIANGRERSKEIYELLEYSPGEKSIAPGN